MLYIIYNATKDGWQATKEWHVDEKVPINQHMVRHVFEVQADGDELEYVLKRFRDLPHILDGNNARIQYWYGDNARFIAGNLT